MTTERSPITTHVLDVSLGKPATAIAVRISRSESGAWKKLGEGKTDADGRVSDLLKPGTLAAGVYQISFEVGPYFALSQRASFYPHVDIVFEIKKTDEHYHVPLLLSPFGYSTYRGS